MDNWEVDVPILCSFPLKYIKYFYTDNTEINSIEGQFYRSSLYLYQSVGNFSQRPNTQQQSLTYYVTCPGSVNRECRKSSVYLYNRSYSLKVYRFFSAHFTSDLFWSQGLGFGIINCLLAEQGHASYSVICL